MAYRFLLLAWILLYSLATAGQKPVMRTNLDTTKLPAGIKYEGKIKNAVRWSDKLGDNIVITTETGNYYNEKFKHETDGSDAELFAYHFILSNDSARQTWKIYDFISDCPVDLNVSFLEYTFSLTDLDNNGVAEVWLIYQTVCTGGVDPAPTKIIMYEGTQKYAIRGESKVANGTDDKGRKVYAGGAYKIDEAFANGPKVFLDFAKSLWLKYILHKKW